MQNLIEQHLSRRARRLGRSPQRGVTLIELMIVVVVLAILGTISVGSYRRYMMRANRSDATTAMLRLQSAQEKHFIQYGAYVTATANLPATGATGLGIPLISERGYYNLAVASSTTGYTATVTPVTGGGQVADTTCATFTVTESGTKRALNSGGTDKTTECFK